MQCRKVQKLFDTYLEGVISQSDKLGLERHLQECHCCSQAFKGHQQLLSLAAAYEAPRLEPDHWATLHNSFMQRLQNEVLTKAPARPSLLDFLRDGLDNLLRPAPTWVVGAAVATLALVASTMLFFPTQNVTAPLARAPQSDAPWVAHLQGSALITRSGSSQSQPLTQLSAINPGDRIDCREGELLLQLDAGTALHLKDNARLSVECYSDTLQRFHLSQGTLLARVSKRRPGQRQEIVTEDALCTIVGTQFAVSRREELLGGATELSVAEGCVTMRPRTSQGAQQAKAVSGGERARILSRSSTIEPIARFDADSLLGELNRIPMAVVAAQHDSTQSFATVHIASEPAGAMVFIQGKAIGTTPLLRALATGATTVSIQMSGFVNWTQSYALSAHQESSIFATLQAQQPAPGQLSSALTQQKLPPSKVPAPAPAPAQAREPGKQDLEEALALVQQGNAKQALVLLKGLVGDRTLSTAQRSGALQAALRHCRHSAQCDIAVELGDRFEAGMPQAAPAQAVRFELALMLSNTCDKDREAIRAFERYVTNYPDGLFIDEAYNSIADIHYNHGRYERAAATYEQLLTSRPSSASRATTRYRLAHLYDRRLGDLKRAVELYEQVINHSSPTAFTEEALFWKADCLYRLKQAAQAKEAFAQYLERYPQGAWNSESHQRLRMIQVADGK